MAACRRAALAGEACWAALGYAVVGPMAIRYDRLEQLAARLHKEARGGPFGETEALSALCGCTGAEFAQVLAHLGFRARPGDGATTFAAKQRPGRTGKPAADAPTAESQPKSAPRRKGRGKASCDPASPFAALQTLVAAK